MTGTEKPTDWRVFMWAGAADVVLGVGLAVAALSGWIGPDLELVAVFGGLMALVGVGIVVWARNKMSAVDGRREDLN